MGAESSSETVVTICEATSQKTLIFIVTQWNPKILQHSHGSIRQSFYVMLVLWMFSKYLLTVVTRMPFCCSCEGRRKMRRQQYTRLTCTVCPACTLWNMTHQ
jgi:hypothetical protein